MRFGLTPDTTPRWLGLKVGLLVSWQRLLDCTKLFLRISFTADTRLQPVQLGCGYSAQQQETYIGAIPTAGAMQLNPIVGAYSKAMVWLPPALLMNLVMDYG